MKSPEGLLAFAGSHQITANAPMSECLEGMAWATSYEAAQGGRLAIILSWNHSLDPCDIARDACCIG